MGYIRVPQETWREYLLNRHLPAIVDIGDQRDPILVIVCSCGIPGRNEAKGRGSNLYSKHLIEVFEKEYYTNVQSPYNGR